MPYITNAIDVEAGEELLLEKPAEAKKKPKVKDAGSKWKTAATSTIKKAEALKSKSSKGVD